MSKVTMTDHARQRLFERHAIPPSDEIIETICKIVEIELMKYTERQCGSRVDIKIPMSAGLGDIVARTVNYRIVTIMTSGRQNIKRILNEHRRALAPSGKTTRAQRITLMQRRNKYMKRWEKE